MAETMQDYLNFPDPQLYLVGFESLDPNLVNSKFKRNSTSIFAKQADGYVSNRSDRVPLTERT